MQLKFYGSDYFEMEMLQAGASEALRCVLHPDLEEHDGSMVDYLTQDLVVASSSLI